jgi:hypothetical protein
MEQTFEDLRYQLRDAWEADYRSAAERQEALTKMLTETMMALLEILREQNTPAPPNPVGVET